MSHSLPSPPPALSSQPRYIHGRMVRSICALVHPTSGWIYDWLIPTTRVSSRYDLRSLHAWVALYTGASNSPVSRWFYMQVSEAVLSQVSVTLNSSEHLRLKLSCFMLNSWLNSSEPSRLKLSCFILNSLVRCLYSNKSVKIHMSYSWEFSNQIKGLHSQHTLPTHKQI